MSSIGTPELRAMREQADQTYKKTNRGSHVDKNLHRYDTGVELHGLKAADVYGTTADKTVESSRHFVRFKNEHPLVTGRTFVTSWTAR